LELKITINTMVDQLSSFASEVTRVAREVGTEGKLGGQAVVRGVAGTWKDLTDNVNLMASNLTGQVRNLAEVTKAVANGDLGKKITVDVRGEILELKNTINTMVDQLSSFASEVTRVAREVGTEGKLGGQAEVKGVAGIWEDLTDNVNSMASNLTAQVRGIARVVTAVAQGDLKPKLAAESIGAKGEIASLAGTINEMIDTLATFADQVTSVAREVGIEGKLGGQARVPSAAGTWRDLTDNVNQLAANLTTQIRTIAEIATAVTKGDLTRSISVDAQGEVAALKDNINQMISNLRETTQKNQEQDWLKTNLARFTRMLQGQRDLETVSRLILKELAPLVKVQQSVFYTVELDEHEGGKLQMLSSWAFRERKQLNNSFRLGEGLVGQCVLEKERILLDEVPGDYIKIGSGLGEAKPVNIIVLPVLFEGEVKAVIELASFYRFNEIHLAFLDQLTESIGIVLNTIAAGMRTEELLKQSTSLADELRSQQLELTETNKRLEQQALTLKSSEERLKAQQEELQQTNEELEERSQLLQVQKAEVERKNRDIEQAKLLLEEKAQQLALSSKYKSEFLANMSHELRTPLNSLLILAKLLADNEDGNLSGKQIDFARTIHAAGSDLLSLINDILDLSKIESGTIVIDIDEVNFEQLQEYVERNFRQVAQGKNLEFEIVRLPNLPGSMFTDPRRLQQVLKNLLANAFKFTERGQVKLTIARASGGWSADHELLDKAEAVLAFSVSDTGIGIPPAKQKIIFEAFQQADGTTSRRFGGTGLGLSISREIARLLGGEIVVESTVGVGSTFTLFLPLTYQAALTPPSTGRLVLADARLPLVPSLLPAVRPPSVSSREDTTESERALLMLPNELGDDRDDLQAGDRTLLIVEDDPAFAKIMLDLARSKGFAGIVALRGDTALALAREYKPDAITLDIRLPVLDGWTVLDRLKHDSRTRHIPVHLISSVDDDQRSRALRQGALAYLRKPIDQAGLDIAFDDIKGFVERRVKNLLIVEDDASQRQAIVELIGNGDVESTAVGSGGEALAELRQKHYDCMVVDLGLPDMRGLELIETIRADEHIKDLPIIVYTGRELTEPEELQLKGFTDSIIIKSVRSMEHLLDETALFLHRVESSLPEFKRRMLTQIHQADPVFAGKRVLIVDDDARNIFALTSVLERHRMEVFYAENGLKGIELLKRTPGISCLLMDVMMPELDGYETTRQIRRMPEFASVPIIALTAKAMKGDREKCIEAGASDYITKPVDTEQLLSLLRVWLYGGGVTV
jgi:CheY-like chemotaxis protein/HAMP domain-containing protein